jgi:ADP-heptose:LPS heptosyltransferase
VAVFNLNTGPAAEEARCELPGLRDLPLPLDDFDDTVAAMRCLDAVVSVDTAAAHVAGALGVPLFLLLPYSRDWRWTPLEGRAPWYGDVRAYAQAYPGDWAEPVRRLAVDLGRAFTDSR